MDLEYLRIMLKKRTDRTVVTRESMFKVGCLGP